MSQPNLDDRIRDLCARAVVADEHGWELVLAELREALRLHSAFVRRIATATLKKKVQEARKKA
jgi:hypothetical protein